MNKYLIFSTVAMLTFSVSMAAVTDYVDPRIGSEGLGRVVIGPSAPFGMVKPSPDCTARHNSGWAPMPEVVNGFSQTHVSGTGGGPKYGNILIMPFADDTMDETSHPDTRDSEDIRLGYYGTRLHSGINVEITTAPRASFYRFTYPEGALQSVMIDAGWFLGEQDTPEGRELQQFVGSEIEVINKTEVAGYSRIRGGWNNGRAYTVYFYAIFDRPMEGSLTWNQPAAMHEVGKTHQDPVFSKAKKQPDMSLKTGASLRFKQESQQLQVKIGISFVSQLKARYNAMTQIEGWSFEDVHSELVSSWDELLRGIEIGPMESGSPFVSKTGKSEADCARTMFYTGLYHTMLEPVDRTGENPLWTDPDVPYYDDFYAIWDTYRTSSPLITLIDQKRQIDIVRSLINIGQRDGFMPDARSGNANGRTQGGSNAEIVLCDAYVKGLAKDIDWEAGLKEMLKDATVPPGGNEEQEGRGGLREYLQLGYVPYGIARSGNRTVEYAFCDYAIAQVAKGLGRNALYEKYMKQSENWKNLWRADYEHAGTRGFIMPRSAEGEWLDELTFGESRNYKPKFRYTPVTNESPWYMPWWGTVFYEATSWEYSLSIPHDVPGLIEICGGNEAFERRLDTFFDRGFYNVNNEPSFLTPCLYHWIGRHDRTSDRVSQIIAKNYNDGSVGLPGNDDSGAMSSWLAFHMMGLYPNAGTDYYLIHTPLLSSVRMRLSNGRVFTIRAPKLSKTNCYIKSIKLNGKSYPYSTLKHADIMQGGELELEMAATPGSLTVRE